MRKITGLLLTLCLGLGLLQAPATADSWTWRDRGGGGGPLSIADVQVAHSPRSGSSITVTFDRPLDPAQMGRDDFVVIDVQTDARGKSEFWVYFVAVRGRLRTFTYHPKYRSVSEGAAIFRRPTPRSIKLLHLDWYERTGTGGHAFAAASYSETGAGCGGGCWDVTPNGGYLIHDYTAPQILAFGAPSGFWLEPEVPVRWRARDRGLSGLRQATLMTSQAGSGQWKSVAARRGGSHRVSVPAVEGGHMMFRVTARDDADNVTTSDFALTRIPYDQASATGPGTFSGLWAEEERFGAMGGTVHTSTAPMDSLSFPGEANRYCVQLHWPQDETVRARLEAGDAFVELRHNLGEEAYEMPYCVETETVEERTATLTVQAGRVGVDWYWAGIEGYWTRAGKLQGREAIHRHAHDSDLTLIRGPRPSLGRFRHAALLGAR